MAANELTDSSVNRRRVLGRWALGVSIASLTLFFVLVGLDKGDKFASIGSLLFAVINASVSVWAAAGGRRQDQPAGPEVWLVDGSTQWAGRDYYEGNYSGISLAEFHHYYDSQVQPLKAEIAGLRQRNKQAADSFRRLEEKMGLLLRAGAAVVVLAVVGGVLLGRWSTGPEDHAKTPPAPSVTTPSTVARDNGALEKQVNEFLAEFHADTRNGGLSKVEVIDRYFAKSFIWYNKRSENDHPRFARENTAKGRATDDCAVQPSVVESVRVDQEQVLVAASVPWVSKSKNSDGKIDVNYTLAPALKGKPFRIVVVEEPRVQTAC